MFHIIKNLKYQGGGIKGMQPFFKLKMEDNLRQRGDMSWSIMILFIMN